jgi:hypothetical protein
MCHEYVMMGYICGLLKRWVCFIWLFGLCNCNVMFFGMLVSFLFNACSHFGCFIQGVLLPDIYFLHVDVSFMYNLFSQILYIWHFTNVLGVFLFYVFL